MNKSKQPVLYLRGLKSIPLSVFCVDKEQKFFYDPIYCNYNSNNSKTGKTKSTELQNEKYRINKSQQQNEKYKGGAKKNTRHLIFLHAG